MTTIYDTVLAYLSADADILAAPCSSRVYLNVWYPDGYKMEDGPCLVIAPRGGAGVTYDAVRSTSLLARGFAVTIADAFAIDAAVLTAFRKTYNPANATAFYAKCTISPDLRRDPGGIYVVSSQYDIGEVL